jgi:hypothetical protein
MKCIAIFLAATLATASAVHAAQLYRWVDSKGNVEWRDTPPPPSAPAKKVEERRVGENVIESGDSYALQLASKNHPVTLWSSSDCGKLCDQSRAQLSKRGIPFRERNPKTDFDAFVKVSPDKQIPVLQVGVITLKGYLQSDWDSALDNAGYPRSAVTRPKPAAAAPQAAK